MYEGTEISKYIEKDSLSFTYTDRAHGAADDVSIMINDDTLKWLNNWFPESGDYIKPIIKYENWRKDGERLELDCGEFLIDEPMYSGPPYQIDIKGNSMPANSGFKTDKKTKAWHNITFEMLAKEIANNSGLKLFFDSQYNPKLSSVLQDNEPDSKFLLDQCEKYGFGFKISNRTIIIYSIAEYEEKKPVATIKRSAGNVVSFTLGKSLTSTAYSAVKARYKDSNGKNKWFIYGDTSSEDAKIYRIEEIAEDYHTAERMTLAKYKELNKNEFKASFTVFANPDLIAASCVMLEDFGVFDGKYFIDNATHNVGSDVSTSFDSRRVVNV